MIRLEAVREIFTDCEAATTHQIAELCGGTTLEDKRRVFMLLSGMERKGELVRIPIIGYAQPAWMRTSAFEESLLHDQVRSLREEPLPRAVLDDPVIKAKVEQAKERARGKTLPGKTSEELLALARDQVRSIPRGVKS